jgi:hypothetical protein
MDDPLTDAELSELERLTDAAAPAPWIAFTGPGIGGPEFIRLDGVDDQFPPDMYVARGWGWNDIAPSADIEFIAAARNYMPRLLAELRRRRGR